MKDYPFETSGLSFRAKGVLQDLYDKPEVYFFEPVTHILFLSMLKNFSVLNDPGPVGK